MRTEADVWAWFERQVEGELQRSPKWDAAHARACQLVLAWKARMEANEMRFLTVIFDGDCATIRKKDAEGNAELLDALATALEARGDDGR